MKINFKTNIQVMIGGGLLCSALTSLAGDPRTNSWLTTYSGKYARIYTNSSMQVSGTSLTSWSNGSQTQSSPAYDGVQEINSSTNWVYIRSSGLASYTMGPWAAGFPNLPTNQKMLVRVPRTNNVPTAKAVTGGGTIGIFVDGVAMFNSWDAFTWNGSSDMPMGTGYWHRDAYVNEGATFDPGYAHQPGSGTYHYHANPIGLRYLLGDHVDFNAATKIFSESTNAVTKHSPILGWVYDGFPVYGPYGYSVSTNPASGVRRMVPGYVLRNGQYGTSNLTAYGRTTIPQWAVRLFNVASNIQSGPAVAGIYTLGRYMEDNDYLGDLINTNSATHTNNFQQGVDFDLDEYNGRWCVTPEFTNGTYAYFVAINTNGTPLFPYNIGRGYYGSPVGGSTTATVMNSDTPLAQYFKGGTNLQAVMSASAVNAASGNVTLVWSTVEGGTYQVNVSSNLTTWTTNLALTTTATNNTASAVESGAAASNPYRFYRVNRTSVAAFDSTGY